MPPVVDLTELQNVVGKYSDHHNLIFAAGPLTAAALTRAFITKNKLVTGAMVAGGAVFAMHELTGPMMKLMHEQIAYLMELLGSFGG